MPSTDLDLQIRLNDLRLRALSGEDLSPHEIRDLIIDLTENRRSSATKAAKTTQSKKEKQQYDLDALMG